MFRKQRTIVILSSSAERRASSTHPTQNLATQGLQRAPSQPQEMEEEIREVFQMHKGMWVIFHTQAALRRESNKILSNERKYFNEEKAKIHIHNHRVQQMKPKWTAPKDPSLLLAPGPQSIS